MVEEFKIVWVCGHQWLGVNTKKNPKNFEEAKQYGCPYCRERKIREEILKPDSSHRINSGVSSEENL